MASIDDERNRQLPLKDLRQEEGAHELATSPEMRPYIDFAKAVLKDVDPAQELKAIRKLPVERRYVWRIVSALKWAFADFDDLSLEADKRTLRPEDFSKVIDLLRLRPIQFCMFLKALVGAEQMERIMAEAIGIAKKAK